MGVKGISKLVKKYGIERNLSFFKNKKIAIDTSIYLYKYMYGTDGNEFIKRFINQIILFRKNNITPIYIFDGKPPEEKQVTLDKRRDIKEKSIKELDNIECEKDREIKKKNVINITPLDIRNLQKIFELCKIRYVTPETEGEKYCSYLNKIDEVDLVLSNDFDSLTFGCKYLLTNQNGKYIEYSLELILKELDISLEKYIEICIASGTDYYPKGIFRIGPNKALTLCKKYGKIENWNVDISDDLKLENIRTIFTELPYKKEYQIIDEEINKEMLINYLNELNIDIDKNTINILI